MRIFFDIVILFTMLVLPFPVTFFLVALGFLLYPRYVEAVAFGALFELLYRGGARDMLGSSLPLAALALSMLVVVEVVRSFIRERTP